jgi:hypothetical protein
MDPASSERFRSSKAMSDVPPTQYNKLVSILVEIGATSSQVHAATY